jgi:hypothetical protein
VHSLTIGVRPHEIAHGAIMRDFLFAVDDADLVKGVDGRGQAAVNAEDAVVDDCGQTQIVEDLSAVAPHVHTAVLAQTLIVEAVHLSDLARLMVPANQGYSVRITHLNKDKIR